MRKHLKLKRLGALVPHQQARPQPIPAERNRIDAPEIIRPRPPQFLTQITRAEPEVQLDTAVTALCTLTALARALSQKLPPTDPRESVLRQRRRRLVAWGAEIREHERHAAACRFATVERGVAAHPEQLGSSGSLPAYDGGAVEEDFEGLAGGEDGRDARVGVRDADLGLRCKAWGTGQRRGLAWAIDHGCCCEVVVLSGWWFG